jgi:short-subunit dehydrogenase
MSAARHRMRIDGKTILITGASEGIGAACAAEFARAGAQLSLTARNEAGLGAVAGGQALVTAGDITNDGVRQRIVERTLERFGAIDILINCAGRGLYMPSWRTPLDDARSLWELNFFAVLAMTQLVLPQMRARRSGMIVNIGSIAGKMPLPWFPLYSASKYALGALTEGQRMELRADGVKTMLVCPGYVSTQFQSHSIGGHPPARVLQGKRFAISAEECARDIRRGIERDARTVVTPRSGWLLIGLMRLLPGAVERRLAQINGTA